LQQIVNFQDPDNLAPVKHGDDRQVDGGRVERVEVLVFYSWFGSGVPWALLARD